MILGDVCTRNCAFCAVSTGRPLPPDAQEPARLAQAVFEMKLKHAVITSVTRDDLADGGAGHWAACVKAVKMKNPACAVEVLVPDFQGDIAAIKTVLAAQPEIFGHNLETVERLQLPIRKSARYARSLKVLEDAKSLGAVTKTGLMLGLGEQEQEIAQTLRDARAAGVDIVTLGQYLRPSGAHAPVERWVHPDEFDRWAEFARQLGFGAVESGPLVRTSYRAEQQSARLRKAD